MSSALAIASVTAVLKNLLNNELIRPSSSTNMGDITVTALAPDRIPLGAEERAQLNLYLYRLTPNSGWLHTNKVGSHVRVGQAQDQSLQASTPNRSLAFDLHYLITAYGERDFQAEMLLGHAIQILHETPVLTAEAIRSVLTSAPVGGNRGVATSPFFTSTLVDQTEEIKVSPESLSMEEMSKLWSTLQAHSRLSVTYQVSAVLIKDRRDDIPT